MRFHVIGRRHSGCALWRSKPIDVLIWATFSPPPAAAPVSSHRIHHDMLYQIYASSPVPEQDQGPWHPCEVQDARSTLWGSESARTATENVEMNRDHAHKKYVQDPQVCRRCARGGGGVVAMGTFEQNETAASRHSRLGTQSQ